MRNRIVASVVAMILAIAGVGVAAASQGNVPTAEPKGCHGAATLAYKRAQQDPSQASGILPQAHSEAGRGETLQLFLAAACDVGRYSQ